MSTDLALIKRDVIDVVGDKIRQFQESKQLHLPANYSAENAMKSAWLILQSTVDRDKRPALQVCTKDSIANSLLDMVVQGLNPMKKQGYFIVYGNQLQFQRSYFGTMQVAKQVAKAKDIFAQVVYGGDEFEYTIDRGRKVVTKHVQRIENVKPDNILAAYCSVEFEDGRVITEIMTFDQIQKAWSKSRQKTDGDNSVHKTFPDQMALKTVINRTCKPVINASTDEHLFLHHFNRADEEMVEAELEQEVAANANGDVIDVDPVVLEELPVDRAPASEQPAEVTKPAAPAREPAMAGAGAGGGQPKSNGPDY